MNPTKEYYKNMAQVVINNMQKRRFDAYYVDNIEEAKDLILKLLGENKVIGSGGSVTLKDAGILELLESKGHTIIKRSDYKTKEEIKEMNKKLITCDAFFTSSNAISMDGQLVNIDGTCSRVSFITYGPESVYVIAGMNKVVVDLDTAISRAKNVAAPLNAIRLEKDTPCTKCGECKDCFENSICCNTVITRRSRDKGRIKVILVGEDLGY